MPHAADVLVVGDTVEDDRASPDERGGAGAQLRGHAARGACAIGRTIARSSSGAGQERRDGPTAPTPAASRSAARDRAHRERGQEEAERHDLPDRQDDGKDHPEDPRIHVLPW